MVRNLDRWKERLARIPKTVREAAQGQLEKEADDLVAAMKRAAPVSGDDQPGQFRDAIHWEPNARGAELSVTVIADPKDEQGRGYAPKVEFGHRTPDGQHVPASPPRRHQAPHEGVQPQGPEDPLPEVRSP